MIEKILSAFNKLPKEKQILAGVGLGVLVCFFIVMRVYNQLLSEINIKARTCTDLEAGAQAARQVALSSWGVLKIFPLIQENEISLVLDEITRKGKIRGINFVSIVPQPAKQKEGTLLRSLPLELETQSSYKSLGIFLGQLQEMKNGFLSLRSIRVTPNNTHPAHVSAAISLDVYLSN